MERESRMIHDDRDSGRSLRDGHKIALRFVHGMGRMPNELELADVRQDLAETVRYVDSLMVKIGILEAHIARLESERATIQSCARIESVAKSRAEIVGISEPCGQIMRISYKSASGSTQAPSASRASSVSSCPFAQISATDMYVACMMPGMPICDGRCMIHASQVHTHAQVPVPVSVPVQVEQTRAPSYAGAVMMNTPK